MDTSQEVVHDGSRLVQPGSHLPHLIAGHTSGQIEEQPQPGERLADLVVQLAREVPALRLLHLYQSGGQGLQSLVPGARLPVQTRVLDRQRTAAGQVFGERQVGRVVPPA